MRAFTTHASEMINKNEIGVWGHKPKLISFQKWKSLFIIALIDQRLISLRFIFTLKIILLTGHKHYFNTRIVWNVLFISCLKEKKLDQLAEQINFFAKLKLTVLIVLVLIEIMYIYFILLTNTFLVLRLDSY